MKNERKLKHSKKQFQTFSQIIATSKSTYQPPLILYHTFVVHD